MVQRKDEARICSGAKFEPIDRNKIPRIVLFNGHFADRFAKVAA
jgi:hypothetical protein